MAGSEHGMQHAAVFRRTRFRCIAAAHHLTRLLSST